jgi:hypothetical protein
MAVTGYFAWKLLKRYLCRKVKQRVRIIQSRRNAGGDIAKIRIRGKSSTNNKPTDIEETVDDLARRYANKEADINVISSVQDDENSLVVMAMVNKHLGRFLFDSGAAISNFGTYGEQTGSNS